MYEDEWGGVRVRKSLLKKVDEFLVKNPNFGNTTAFVNFLINREMER